MAANISIIVAARNNGRYLRDCLRSCQRQTVPARELIYVDDGSNDDSVQIAAAIPGVNVLCITKCEGVVAARNCGVRESSGDVLVHVDGDDLLTPDFLQRHLEALDRAPAAGFAYGPAQLFGLHNVTWHAPRWNSDQLWRANYVNTSAMFRRRVFDAAGGWRQTSADTAWDWHLALRASRLCSGTPSAATLLYRKHAASWSEGRDGDADRQPVIAGAMRRELARVAVCSVLSGDRDRGLDVFLPDWLDAISTSLAGRPASFYLLCNGDPEFTDQVECEAMVNFARLGNVIVAPWPLTARRAWNDDADRRNTICKFMSASCNRLLGMSEPAEAVWFVEDDILVPPHAFANLFQLVTDGPIAAASGAYRVRHEGHRHNFVAKLHHRHGNAKRSELPLWPVPAERVGTGCLLIWRPEARHEFPSHDRHGDTAHDWAWCEIARGRGQTILIDPRVHCHHFVRTGEWV